MCTHATAANLIHDLVYNHQHIKVVLSNKSHAVKKAFNLDKYVAAPWLLVIISNGRQMVAAMYGHLWLEINTSLKSRVVVLLQKNW